MRRRRQVLIHLALFLVTFATTTMAGALFVHGDTVRPLSDGLAYSVPLLLILTCHELGHYVVARRHGVDASLPYFVPIPPQIGLGTFGAFISMRGVTSNRTKLIDIGAAGPLAGMVIAIPVILYGLHLSPVRMLEGIGQQEGNSLLYLLLKYAAKGAWLPDAARRDVILHPTAWAGWAGLLLTMINLLPIWQLDGGHIATAYFGNRYARFARWLHRALPFLGIAVFLWVRGVVAREAGTGPGRAPVTAIAILAALPWLLWFVMVLVMRRLSGGVEHPPVDDDAPLPRSRRILFWIVVAVFVMIFMPVPLRMTLAPGASEGP